jgi:hypothetical protein
MKSASAIKVVLSCTAGLAGEKKPKKIPILFSF